MMQPHAIVVVTPAVTTDRRGSTGLDYGPSATRAAALGFMQQRTASETLGDRDLRTSDWVLFSRSTPTLDALDQIEWNNLTFQVAGQPDHLTNGSTRAYSHTEADLRLVAG